MKKNLLSLLFFIALPVILFAQNDKPVITILDFNTTGISQQEASLIVDFMSSYIVETRRYIVIDRMQRESILREIEWSVSDCTDEDCQLEVGKMLAANLIVVGSLGRVGDRYILNLKLIDVETGATLNTASNRFDDINSLIDSSDSVVRQLIVPDIETALLENESNNEISNEDELNDTVQGATDRISDIESSNSKFKIKNIEKDFSTIGTSFTFGINTFPHDTYYEDKIFIGGDITYLVYRNSFFIGAFLGFHHVHSEYSGSGDPESSGGFIEPTGGIILGLTHSETGLGVSLDLGYLPWISLHFRRIYFSVFPALYGGTGGIFLKMGANLKIKPKQI